ncbi:MAG: hypothetical protein LW714_10120 [Oxalobacteraceae bacterium]|jgi:hypothetical protein|nr:hypothetical protein [Oxalobacteraceae bacterium]
MLRLAMSVLWPSFLTAILAEGFFFSVFDPADLMLVGGYIDIPPVAVYTLGFFFFWAFCSLASMLSIYMLRTELSNEPPF